MSMRMTTEFGGVSLQIDFLALDVMLEGKLINNAPEPDDAFNVH
jgi:hypothetical protein